MAAATEKKLLGDLGVVQLKSELEKRNLDKAGSKVILLERLATALREEGHDPETDLLEVPEISPDTGDGPQEVGEDEGEEYETGGGKEEVDDSDKIVIPLGDDDQVEESHQDAEMIDEVAEDALVEDEEMVDEEHLLALEEDQPANQEGGEAADGDQEEEDGDMQINAEDFTDVDVLGEEDDEGGAGERVERDQSVTAKEDSMETGTDSQNGTEPTSAAAPATASGASVSSSVSSASSAKGAKPSGVTSSSAAVKKPPAATNSGASASKPSGASAKPAGAAKSATDTKPTMAVRPKVAVKPGSSAKPAAGAQKPGITPPRTDSAQKQTVAKLSAGQKAVTSTLKSSAQAAKAGGQKTANVSAISQPGGDKESGKDKDGAASQAGEDSFDVQVDDTVLKEIDADLLNGEQAPAAGGRVEAAAEGQEGDQGASGVQQQQEEEPTPAPDANTSVPQQPPTAAAEEETADASAKEQDSAQKDDKKPEEKKDEKDAKPVKSGSAQAVVKPVKGKDDKGTANSRNLWVSGLSSSTRATDLKNLFGKYGKVVGAKVVTNARSPGWHCYGFVTMASADETTKCIQHLHRTELHGKMISVERFSSFKAKTGGPVKTSASSKTITGRSITGKSTPVTITTRNIAVKKEDKKTPASRKEGGKDGDKKPVKKDCLKEGSKDGKKEDQSKDKPEDKKSDKPGKKDEKDGRRSHQSSRDRSRHRDSEKSREQRERDMLSFEKIRAERERERLRQKELQLRCEERYRIAELDRERQRQKLISRKQRDEAMELEREKEKLRQEKERLEFERQESERLRRETSRLKKMAEEKLRREQERLEEERRAIKRPAPPPKVSVGDYWGEAAKQSRKDTSFKSVRDRDFRRDDRREERSGHRDMREDFSGRDSHSLGGNGPVSGRGHSSRDSRKVSGSHHSWGTPADSHSKMDSGWGRGHEGNGSGDRWMGSSSISSQHQRTGSTSYSSHGHGSHRGHSSRGMSSSGGGNVYMSSGTSHSISGSGMSRQQDARFNIAAITARRF
ncbi:hypothetical protein ACOMHN_026766 [Nucella lapillus]